jgi:hypothetical protein
MLPALALHGPATENHELTIGREGLRIKGSLFQHSSFLQQGCYELAIKSSSTAHSCNKAVTSLLFRAPAQLIPASRLLRVCFAKQVMDEPTRYMFDLYCSSTAQNKPRSLQA